MERREGVRGGAEVVLHTGREGRSLRSHREGGRRLVTQGESEREGRGRGHTGREGVWQKRHREGECGGCRRRRGREAWTTQGGEAGREGHPGRGGVGVCGAGSAPGMAVGVNNTAGQAGRLRHWASETPRHHHLLPPRPGRYTPSLSSHLIHPFPSLPHSPSLITSEVASDTSYSLPLAGRRKSRGTMEAVTMRLTSVVQ